MFNKFKRFLLRRLIRFILKLHNLFYGLAGLFSIQLEPGKIHPKHRILDYHQWFISQIEPEWDILDVGCGNGALSADLAKHCKRVVGIDISSKNIALAKKTFGPEFICGDATVYPFSRNFDAIVLSNVLEHIEDRTGFLEKMMRQADKFLIRVPMIDRDWITLYKKELGVNYKLDPGHFIEYTLEGLIQELQSVGLKIKLHRICYGEIYALAVKEK
ncbi:MAG: class I SAM-dependent methyltransferase [Candidatus Omnitrophica bacterium]|nr:class I SAM-dependent methyltransferase [Candidatus Omnitrophota bacterium]